MILALVNWFFLEDWRAMLSVFIFTSSIRNIKFELEIICVCGQLATTEHTLMYLQAVVNDKHVDVVRHLCCRVALEC